MKCLRLDQAWLAEGQKSDHYGGDVLGRAFKKARNTDLAGT